MKGKTDWRAPHDCLKVSLSLLISYYTLSHIRGKKFGLRDLGDMNSAAAGPRMEASHVFGTLLYIYMCVSI